MTQPKNELAQTIIAACELYDVTNIVISPGSRNAPLIIGFKDSEKIRTFSIVDERSAGFFALGLAQQLRKPVALVCTSGSALLNYYPAVAEAFYSNIPLLVISADRPSHLIDIGDGQTIRQKNVFENHIVHQLNMDGQVDFEQVHLAFHKVCTENGPVHINVPFDEPLYQTVSVLEHKVKDNFNRLPFKSPEETPLDVDELEKFAETWNNSAKKIVLVGEHFPDNLIQTQLEHLAKDPSVLILIENTANVFHLKFINSIDKLIFPLEDEELEKFRPEILLSFGGMIVSKKIKQHLRRFQPNIHWHVDKKRAFDTFHCLSHHFKVSPQLFFSQFFFLTKNKDSSFQNYWLNKKKLRLQKHTEFVDGSDFSDLKVFHYLAKSFPKAIQLQLGNSSVIRYAQLFDIEPSIRVFCNRGTSGIDGSTSTAIGAAFARKEQTVFVSGDISFFYDSNGLWNQYIPVSFRFVLINNGGGGIFRFIPGPKDSKALEYFETPHQLVAEHLCKMYGIHYRKAQNEEELQEQLSTFYEPSSGPKLLEVFTPQTDNDRVLRDYFNYLKA